MKRKTPVRNRTSKQTSYISALEAAVQAGAAYVRQTAYDQGRKDGWEDGWKAAMSGDKTSHATTETPRKRQALSASLEEPEDKQEEDEQEEEEPPQIFELTEECARLFARSMKAPKRKKQSQQESPSDEIEQLDLGGLMEKRRRHHAMKTYGADARQVAELEAELSANFERIVSDTSATYWPVVPLRDGERPIEIATTP